MGRMSKSWAVPNHEKSTQIKVQVDAAQGKKKKGNFDKEKRGRKIGAAQRKQEKNIKIIDNFGYIKEALHFGFCIQFVREKNQRVL